MNSKSMTERVLQAAQVVAAAAMLLRIGGYGDGWLPSTLLCLLSLVLLMSVGRIQAVTAAGGQDEAIERVRAWAKARWFWLGLAAVGAVALALRLYGIGNELGHIDVGIDQKRLTRSVLHFFETGEINHTTVEHYPGIHFWFLSASFSIAYLWGLMQELAANLSRMPQELFILTGKIVGAFQGTITVLLTGLLGKRLVGPRVGLLAAGLLAISPLSIELSMQVRNDASQAMLITAAVVVALGNYRSGRGLEAFVAGTLAGLATGVKYSSLFVVIPVFLAAATSQQEKRRGPSLALALGGFVAALALSNHFLWADVPNFLKQLSDQIGITDESHWAAMTNPAAFHVSILASRVVGWPLMIAATAIAALRLAAGRWRWWMFLSFPLIYIWFVAQRPSQFPRWVYPSAPFVAVAASAGLFALVAFLADRAFGTDPRRKNLRLAASLLLSLLLLSPILWTWGHQTSRRLATPTYSLIEAWLEEEFSPGDRVLVEREWLELDRRRFRVRRVRDLRDVLDGGADGLARYDWIIVHEWRLNHPTLENLELIRRFQADTSFGGSTGPDFAVYRAPGADVR